MPTIYADKALMELGYSGSLSYEGEIARISRGSTNSLSKPRSRVLIVDFKPFELTVVCGEKEYEEWNGIATRDHDHVRLAESFIWKVLMENLTKDLLLSFLDSARKKGVNKGREVLQREFSDLMGIS